MIMTARLTVIKECKANLRWPIPFSDKVTLRESVTFSTNLNCRPFFCVFATVVFHIIYLLSLSMYYTNTYPTCLYQR